MATAQDVLKRAQELTEHGEIAKAKNLYQAIIDKMPGTDFAKTAQEKLDALSQTEDVTFDLDALENSDNPYLNGQDTSADALLTRTKLFIEDDKWEDAEKYINRVLDMDPENGEAYYLALLVNYECHDDSELVSKNIIIQNDPLYKKIIRFGSDGIKQKIVDCIQQIDDNREKTHHQEMIEKLTSQIDTSSDIMTVVNAYERLKTFEDFEGKKEVLNRAEDKIFDAANLKIMSSVESQQQEGEALLKKLPKEKTQTYIDRLEGKDVPENQTEERPAAGAQMNAPIKQVKPKRKPLNKPLKIVLIVIGIFLILFILLGIWSVANDNKIKNNPTNLSTMRKVVDGYWIIDKDHSDMNSDYNEYYIFDKNNKSYIEVFVKNGIFDTFTEGNYQFKNHKRMTFIPTLTDGKRNHPYTRDVSYYDKQLIIYEEDDNGTATFRFNKVKTGSKTYQKIQNWEKDRKETEKKEKQETKEREQEKAEAKIKKEEAAAQAQEQAKQEAADRAPKTVTLSSGNYTCGYDGDFNPGKYDITLVSGRGNVISYDAGINEVFGPDADWGQIETYKNASFTFGATLQISGGVTIRLTPSD